MFSKACKYGMRSILHLAVHSDEGNRIGVSEIADKLEVPKFFLAKVLQLLVKENLISSSKGPGGGFYLNEENLNANLKEVIEAIDGTEFFTDCIMGLKKCSLENPCPLHIQAFGMREGLSYQLEYQTIAEHAEKIKRKKTSV